MILSVFGKKGGADKGEGVMQDLIIEADGIKASFGTNFQKYGADFDCCELDEKLAKKHGRKAGSYVTVQTNADSQVGKALVYALKRFVKGRKSGLVVGMGNGDVIADALGKRVVENLKKKDLSGGRLSVFAPDVGALTNLDSVKLVQAVTDGFSPDYVVAVDALATSRVQRLCACYQFTDAALRPGGGVGKGSVMDSKLLKTHFIAIGVPFIIGADDICAGGKGGYFVPYDVDAKVEFCAARIADALFACFG